MSVVLWYMLVGSLLVVAGMVRMLLTRDLVGRLIAMNVVGVGSLALILALAARSPDIDPVLSALVITGLVITAAFTALAAVLIRRIEEDVAEAGPASRPASDPRTVHPNTEHPNTEHRHTGHSGTEHSHTEGSGTEHARTERGGTA